MGLAIDMVTRLQIVREASAGISLISLSKKYQVNYNTCCKFYRNYKSQGKAGLKTNYGNCGPKTIKSNYFIYRASCWLKRLHPNWGASFILLQIKEKYPELDASQFPSIRTLQRWFVAKGYNPPRQKKTSR